MDMRNVIVALLFVFMLLMMTWVYLAQSVTILQRLANVSQIEGQVTYVSKGETTPKTLAENYKVKEGDVVETAANSSALLTWVDGSKVRIGPSSQLEISKCSTKGDKEVSLFNLNSGEVWTRISKRLRRDSKFEIKTPAAVAGVRGTIFSLAVTPAGDTVLSILEGSVSASTPLMQSNVLFSSGMIVGFEANGKFQTLYMTEKELAEWQQRKDFLGPLLTVSNPKEGETLPVGTCKVAGSAEPGASVLVNGQKAGANRLGRFSAEVSLAPGENTIEVEAVDRFAHSTVVERKVKGSAENPPTKEP
jgi:hypothetical protein